MAASERNGQPWEMGERPATGDSGRQPYGRGMAASNRHPRLLVANDPHGTVLRVCSGFIFVDAGPFWYHLID